MPKLPKVKPTKLPAVTGNPYWNWMRSTAGQTRPTGLGTIPMPPPSSGAIPPSAAIAGGEGWWNQIRQLLGRVPGGKIPAPLPQMPGGAAGALAKGGLRTLGGIAKVTAVPETFGWVNRLARAGLSNLFPDDPYYAGGWLGAPDPEMFYRQKGGAQLTPEAQAVLARTGEEGTSLEDRLAAQAALRESVRPKDTTPPSSISQEDIDRGYSLIGGSVVPIEINAAGIPYRDWANVVAERLPAGQAALPQAPWRSTEALYPSPYDNPQTPETEGIWTGTEWMPPQGYVSPQEQWQRDWMKEQSGAEQKRWESQRAWEEQREQMRLTAERETRLAQLRANPASWLEYASFAGQTPTIQPWMVPLGQEYNMQAGQPIQGYQAGGEKMNLPELTTPSAQYMSRMSPSMRQQYGGYEQARTGQTPQDVEWRLWSQAAPSGRFGGLRRLGR